jgi:dTDP-4-dehydrorhamnose 3,5-epimerase
MKLSEAFAPLYRKQDYSSGKVIEGVRVIELQRFNDDGGAMTELARLREGVLEGLEGFVVRQINFSEIQPGTIKAFHVHLEQSDLWYVPPSDRVLLVLLDVRAGSPTESVSQRIVLGDSRSRMVLVPPGVAHGCRNIGQRPGHIIYFTDRQFDPDPERCDEGRLPWDVVGQAIWEAPRE